jgi:hypothetical protein
MKPGARTDQLDTALRSREVFRCRKADRIRSYRLRALPAESVELWVISEGRGTKKSRKLVTLTRFDDVAPFLRSIEQELRDGGWVVQGWSG